MVTPEYSAAMRPDQSLPHAIGWDKEDPTSKELFLDGMLEVPHYGEPCEACEDGYGTGNGAQGSGSCPPEQYAPSQVPTQPQYPANTIPAPPAGEIQTMSGRDDGNSRVIPAGGDPFRMPVRKELPTSRKASTTRSPAEAPLPGAIRPKTGSARPVNRSMSADAPNPDRARNLSP